MSSSTIVASPSSIMATSNTGGSGLESSSTVTIDSWLKDLRMECYKRNLENFPNFQSLLLANDIDLKKAGIHNARDRSTMINSLSSYPKATTEGYTNKTAISGFGSRTIRDQQQADSSRSLLKKGTPMKKLKGFLGAGNQKKGKKVNEVQITSPNIILSEVENKTEPDNLSQSLPNNRHSLSLEDLIKSMENQQHHIVENDYVPEPQTSPLMCHNPLQRSYTVSVPQPSPKNEHLAQSSTQPGSMRPSTINFDELPPQSSCSHNYRTRVMLLPECRQQNEEKEFDHLSPKDAVEETDNGNHFGFEDSESSTESSKHLSLLSVESGLGLTCEPDDNFNTSLALEEQPWFHGRLNRSTAEALLQEDGDFLVHEDAISDDVYTLSILWEGRCFHLLINCDEVVMKGIHGRGVTIGYKYKLENGAFDSVPELIFNHLNYKIPVSRDLEAVIRHPVSKPGRNFNNVGEQDGKNRTLPKNFSYSLKKNRVMSPESGLTSQRNNAVRSLRSASFSPADSPRGSPVRDLSKNPTKTTMTSSASFHNIPEIPDEDEASDLVLRSIYNDVPDSPVPTRAHLSSSSLREDRRSVSPTSNRSDQYATYDVPVPSCNPGQLRSKGNSDSTKHKTSTSTISSDISDYQQPRPYDPDDYEEMRSVSVFDTLSPSPVGSPKHSPKMTHRPFSSLSQEENNQYAFLTPKGGTLKASSTGPQPGVKYAEITFRRSNTVTPSDYSSGYPHSIHGKQSKVTYVTTKTLREEVANLGHPLAKQVSVPANTRIRPNLPRQSSTDLLRPSRPVSFMAKNTKIPQSIQEIPSFLKDLTNEELAAHLTKADSVCFLLSPRPAEDLELWTNRVQEVTADGVFVGLQVLASSSGVKLWKKLFNRHLSLSQLVTLCILQTAESVERTKVLKKWIELAQLLQSGTYGNLFSFMAIMKGLESTQIKDLTRTWELLKVHFSDVHDIYDKQLKGMISALMQGASVYAIDGLTVPAIQHLKKLYSDETEPVGSDVQSLLEDFTTRATGLDGLHSIIGHAADLSSNATKRLSSYPFDAVLFDFFMQDIARMHLQNMGTSSEDPLERYRRFSIVLDSLYHKLENP